jgi:NAD(P)-dependent dehydrogenase (short-subunit alcohol dehydrogenase family)
VILVTGGCNGIGRAICEGFAASGAQVICGDIDDQAANSLPQGVVYHHLDVSNEADCSQIVSDVLRDFGGLDVLVNNAAIQPPSSYQPVDKVSTNDYQRMLNVNLSGYFYMAKQVLPVMRQQKSGVIINMASGQGHRTARSVPVYGPIKAANILQAMQWGIEYARDGIRVLSVSPGAIDTPLVRASLAVQGGANALANRHPIGRLGRPEEIAHAVLWLSSSDASFITATDLSVDGGLAAFGAFAEPYDPATVCGEKDS